MTIEEKNQLGLDGIQPKVDMITQIDRLETEADQMRQDIQLANEVIYTLKALVPENARAWMRLDALNMKLKRHYK